MNPTDQSQVLQMVESGQVSVQDAIGLLSSLPVPKTSARARRWLHVRVTNLSTGQGKVNVRVPLNWVRLGLTLGTGFVPELQDVDLDEVIASLEENATDHIVQVENVKENQRVEVYVE